MLPVIAWPPGPPGDQLSPFGRPRDVDLSTRPNGFVLPKGAWVIHTDTATQVVMFTPVYTPASQQMGTGFLPGSTPPPGPTPPTYDQNLEAWRAWQRTTGLNYIVPPGPPGRTPPNWGGWQYVPATSYTLVPPGSSRLVLADGQNVVIIGSGHATIIEAYSV